MTNLFNQYIQQTAQIGTCTPSRSICLPGPSGTVPLYGTKMTTNAIPTKKKA